MFIRLKEGAYAGEIREVKFADGRVLVDSGRADLVDPSVSPDAHSAWLDARAPRLPRGPRPATQKTKKR